MDALIHLIYASAATDAPTADALRALLVDSRPRNADAGITGMLLYEGGSYFQVLEGPPAAVDATFARIARDPRHDGVVTIIRERIARRAFGAWSMGYVAPSSEALAAVAAGGGNDFFAQASCVDDLAAGRAKRLLSAFREGRWHAARA